MQQLKFGTLLQGGKYRIERVLGQGGFGITYLAYNTVFDVNVAIKEFFMKDENERNGLSVTISTNAVKQELFENMKMKFKKEAKRMYTIKSDHVVNVHDLFEENGTAYYVMEYIDGESLKDRLARTKKTLSEKEVKKILLQILDALKSIHAHDIFHLDLKPANIMIDKQGLVKLIDFGASKQFSSVGGFTTSTAYCYTPGYAPIEQIRQKAEQIGPWTDFFALGATLYYLLTLDSPSNIDIEEDGEEAISFGNGISEEMKKMVIWLMTPQRKKRPQSVDEIIARLSKNGNNEETNVVGNPKETGNGDETILEQPKSHLPKVIQQLIDNMVFVEGGTFQMGRELGLFEFTDEGPVHDVTLSSFSIGKYEVTQEEWEAVMGNNPSHFKGAKLPVESVDWDDCQEFIGKLNELVGMNFRLPTEAEWEFAARGGNMSKGYKYAGSKTVDDVAWYFGNSKEKTQKVGSKKPNELGLYDMSGNVWEWCQDWYGNYSNSDEINPTGPVSGTLRVDRGGSLTAFASSCRVSYRDSSKPEYKSYLLGFRLAL